MARGRIDEIVLVQKNSAVGPSDKPTLCRQVYWFDLGVVCERCAAAFGRRVLGLATFYETQCDCCKETVVCTERRDYKRIVVEE